jgi:hypothetical protein
MMNMMSYNTGMWGWSMQWLFCGTLIIGAVLFLLWANKALDAKKLGTWATWAIIIGLIGTLLTGGMWSGGWSGMHGGFSRNIDWQVMGLHMQEDDHSELSTAQEWQDHMWEEMKGHMNVR